MEYAVRIAHLANRAYKMGGAGSVIAKVLSKINRIVFTCDISPRVHISKTTGLRHQGLGVVIHPNAVIGENVVIRQHVSIGTNAKPGQGGLAPKIGNGVMGNNVVIGANAVVLKDVPDDSIAVGVPAKIIKR